MLQIRIDERPGDGVVVTLAGELDMATSPLLAKAFAEVLDRQRLSAVTIDLAEVNFLDSSGMRALLQARSAVVERGADYAVRRPTPQVAKVLRIAALDEILNIDEEGSASPA
jgi:anti-sigma B factor antagonist